MPDKTKPVRFWQEITLTLALKLFVLFVIWAVWFSATDEMRIDDQAVASQILSRQLNKDHDHDTDRRTR